MLRRIKTMILKDLRTGGRDQLTLYILISPILLGLLVALFVPIFEDAQPQFVVTEALAAVAPESVRALDAHGEVEVVADRAALERRVLARDDVTGVVPLHAPARPGEVEVIVEGDEPEALRGLARAIIDHEARVRDGALVTRVDIVEVGEGATDIRLALSALLGFCVPVLVGLMFGFTILEEKTTETKTLYDVSPLRYAEYLAAKLGVLALLSAIMVVPALAIPLGLGLDWLAIELSLLASLPFAASFGLLLGVFAKDQLGAIALTKGLSPVWTSLPILGFALPEAWMWTQFPFANHWGVQGLFHALGDGVGVWTHAGLSLATGLPVFVVTVWLLRRRLGFT